MTKTFPITDVALDRAVSYAARGVAKCNIEHAPHSAKMFSASLPSVLGTRTGLVIAGTQVQADMLAHAYSHGVNWTPQLMLCLNDLLTQLALAGVKHESELLSTAVTNAQRVHDTATANYWDSFPSAPLDSELFKVVDSVAFKRGDLSAATVSA